MRKIDSSIEDPFDNLYSKLAEKLCPLFKKLNFTPNGITTVSIIFGLLSIYFIYNYNILYFAIFWIISYFFDCMDGYYARKYKMTSKYGDLYDHVGGSTINILLLIVILSRYNMKTKVKLISLFTILIFLLTMNMYLGCQQKILNKNETESIDITKKLCFGEPKGTLKYIRFFGTGFFNILIIIVIIYIHTNSKRKHI